MYTQQFVSRMDPVVDAAPETLLFRTATLIRMTLWKQPNEKDIRFCIGMMCTRGDLGRYWICREDLFG